MNTMKKRGFALITILVILILITMGAVAILKAIGSHNTMKAISLQELKSQYLAEAATQAAMWRCRNASGNCTGVPNLINVNGTNVNMTVIGTPQNYTINGTVDYGSL